MRWCFVVAAIVSSSLTVGCSSDPAGTGGASSSSASAGSTVAHSSAHSSVAVGTQVASSGTGLAPVCPGKTATVGDHEMTISIAGTDRTYRVHVPPGYDAEAAHMVVIMMHGYFQTNDQIESVTGMTSISDERGFLVVYPQGLGNSWNAGACCGTSSLGDVPDVQFITSMLDEIEAAHCVDPKRVYAAGFSNGGMMSHRLACEVADRIAAIGPVSGTVAIDTCNPSRPVPVMHTHGSADFVVPWDGGGLGGAKSVDETIQGWVTRDACTDTTPATVYQNGGATCTEYSACAESSAVRLCRLEGGGHQWPDGNDGGGGVGTLSMDLDASHMMIDFFEAHPMP